MGENPRSFRPEVLWDDEVAAYLRGALGPERFARTAQALNRPPLTTCLRVNTLRTTTREVVELVRRNCLGQEWSPDVVQVHPQVPCAVLLRGSGPHEVSYEAAGGREVVVSRKAGEAVLRGAPVYAPGVLAVSSGVARGDLVALAVGREKPGSDVPDITRGTTLYVTVARDNNRPEPASGEVPHDGAEAAAEAAPAGPVVAPDADDTGETAAAGPRCCDGVAASEAGPGAASGQGTTGDNPSLEAPAGPSAAASPRARHRHRRRHRPGHPEGTEQGKRTTEEAGSNPDPGEGEGTRVETTTAAAAGSAGPSASPAAVPSTAAAAAAGTALAASCPPPPPPPGWTPSSQGLIPPRSGRYVGLARAAMSRQEMFRAREGLALELVEPVFRVPPAAGSLPPGSAMLQNLPSLVAALALSPPPGSRVLDMCAAPGGKTTLLAALMGDVGEVVAFDRTHAKVAEIVSLARELGVTCIRAQKMDAGRALERPAGQQGQQQQQEQEGEGPAGSAPEGGPGGHAAAAAGKVVATQNGAGGADDTAVVATAHAGSASRAHGGGKGGPQQQQVTSTSTPTSTPTLVPVVSEKARLREERRRAAMIRRGITPPDPAAVSNPASGLPAVYPPESFDHILLDAPCSALGLRPRLQQQATCLYLRQCGAAQRRLMDAAVRLLRVGGSLVYSTCTINPGENEACVRWLLDKYGSCFRLVPAGPPFLGGPGLVGRHPTMTEAGRPVAATATATAAAAIAADTAAAAAIGDGSSSPDGVGDDAGAAGRRGDGGGGGGDGEQWLTATEAALVQRFDPADPQLDTIGFFVAKFNKTAPVPEGPP